MLKFLLGVVTVILVVITIAGVAVWMATFSTPPEAKFPRLVGMKIDQARDEAAKAGIHLMEHEEYNDKLALGTVYKVDPDMTGRTIKAGRSINVWISKGSHFVDVPDVLKLFKDDAAKKLEEAGLALGQVDPHFDQVVPLGYVTAQNPRSGKRVPRDTTVNLMISDGPDPNKESPEPPAQTDNTDTGAGTANQGGATPDGITNPTPGDEDNDQKPRVITLSKPIARDGKGARRVKIEYDDAVGTKTAVDEMHNEGDTVSAKVTVIGRKVTVRVYYNDDPIPVSERKEVLKDKP